MENLKTSHLDKQKDVFIQKEENKQELINKNPVFSDSFGEAQKTGVEKQDVVQEVKEEMKQGLAEATVKKEKDLQPVDEEEVSLEDKLFKMAGKYKQKEDGDSDRMKAVREALKEFEKEKQGNITNNIRVALHKLIGACKSYCFMRFSLFRSERGKQRLAEVRSILEDAKQIEADYVESTGDTYKDVEERIKEQNEEKQKNLIYQFDGYKRADKYDSYRFKVANEFIANKATNAQKLGIAVGAAARFVGYNALRAVGTAVALPFVGIYTGISKLRQKYSKTYVHRPVDLSWKWKFGAGVTLIAFDMVQRKKQARRIKDGEEERGTKTVGYKNEFRSTVEKRIDVEQLGIKLTKEGGFYTEAEGEQLVKDGEITQEEFEALRATDFFIDEDVLEEMKKTGSTGSSPDNDAGDDGEA